MDKIKILFLFVMTQLAVWAQTTGNFEATINFNGETRVLSGYVPTSYDSTLQYQVIIGLHGMSDGSNNYRNALINSNWMDVFSQTILICPDGGNDPYSDFNVPVGDEAIIEECINYVNQNFNIDTNAIILQGFSLGGRAALKYGLNHPTKFKGLLLNTPAVQGVNDALNTMSDTANIHFEYANASQVPIFMTVGADDVLYEYTLQAMYPILKKNNAQLKYEVIPSLGHTIPSNAVITDGLNFFNQPIQTAYNLDLFEISNAKRTCESNFTPQCYVRNLGDSTVNTIELEYELDGTDYTYTWTGNLASFEHVLIDLPSHSLNDGSHNLSISIGEINVGQTDILTNDNTLTFSFESGESTYTLPFTAGFEDSPDAWIFEENFNVFEWGYDEEVYKTGSYSLSNFNCPLLFDTKGRVESIVSPVIDLSSSGLSHRTLSFELAYNYLRYEPPMVITPSEFADTLEILISTDCGASFQSIFRKGGYNLRTTNNPILNPLSIEACIFYPTEDEWERIEIDLNEFIAAEEVQIKFSYLSGMGGTIYIDDMKIGSEPIGLTEEIENGVSISPNPASNYLLIDGKESSEYQVSIYTIQGKKVFEQSQLSAHSTIDISQLTAGYYEVEILYANQRTIEKLIISK